jgi:hypothetical protein
VAAYLRLGQKHGGPDSDYSVIIFRMQIFPRCG